MGKRRNKRGNAKIKHKGSEESVGTTISGPKTGHISGSSSQSLVLNFSECLNAKPGVLVVGSKRREDKN